MYEGSAHIALLRGESEYTLAPTPETNLAATVIVDEKSDLAATVPAIQPPVPVQNQIEDQVDMADLAEPDDDFTVDFLLVVSQKSALAQSVCRMRTSSRINSVGTWHNGQQ